MSRQSAAVGTLVFFFVAPGVVAGLIPYIITSWRSEATPAAYAIVRVFGAILVAGGLAMLIESFVRFAVEGRGTPAPPAPTAELVVRGAYRYVRNPMYVAVSGIIIGQVLLFANWGLLIYAAVIMLAFHLFVVFYEEPTLARTHGQSYEKYRAAVPRWMPHLPPHPYRT
jgi:protein-S-isoprenylcysteine O-methyltransferase Ste14